MAADVRDIEAVGKALKAGFAEHGQIDVLVSGAAGNLLSAANDLSSNGFRAVVDIDLVGTFHVMRAAFPYLAKPGASVINITAPQSFIAMRYQAHLCAAKAGVDQITRVLALEWGPDGVRVNSISPGPIADTEGARRLSAPDTETLTLEAIPLGRMGSKQDIAWLAMFLSSPYASYISGALPSPSRRPCGVGHVRLYSLSRRRFRAARPRRVWIHPTRRLHQGLARSSSAAYLAIAFSALARSATSSAS